MVTKSTFIHNTKITYSKMGEDKNREKYRKNPQVRCITHMEILHVMLKYPEVVKNLNFIKVSTITLELRSVIIVNSGTETKDGSCVLGTIESFRRSINLDDFILHTENQLMILDDLKLSKIPVDRMTHFCLRPPELCESFDKLVDYYRWLVISIKVKENVLLDKIIINLSDSFWVDAFQIRILVRKKSLPKIM